MAAVRVREQRLVARGGVVVRDGAVGQRIGTRRGVLIAARVGIERVETDRGVRQACRVQTERTTPHSDIVVPGHGEVTRAIASEHIARAKGVQQRAPVLRNDPGRGTRRHRKAHPRRDHRIPHGRDPLIRREKLRAIHAVVEPHPQAHIGIRKDTRGHHRHVCQRRITQQHGVEALAHRQRDRCRRLVSHRARAVIAPVGRGTRPIDERKLEQPAAVKIHRTHGETPLVVDELRHLREERRGGDQKKEGERSHELKSVHGRF